MLQLCNIRTFYGKLFVLFDLDFRQEVGFLHLKCLLISNYLVQSRHELHIPKDYFEELGFEELLELFHFTALVKLIQLFLRYVSIWILMNEFGFKLFKRFIFFDVLFQYSLTFLFTERQRGQIFGRLLLHLIYFHDSLHALFLDFIMRSCAFNSRCW